MHHVCGNELIYHLNSDEVKISINYERYFDPILRILYEAGNER